MFYYARMIEQFITTAIEHSLSDQAAVAIIGPRQVGKTTLAREIAACPLSHSVCCLDDGIQEYALVCSKTMPATYGQRPPELNDENGV